MIVGSLLNRKRALHICKKKPVYSQKRPTKKPDSCSAPEGQELLLACACLHTHTHEFQHLPHTHTHNHPPTHTHMLAHTYTYSHTLTCAHKQTEQPPLLLSFHPSPLSQNIHTPDARIFCVTKKTPLLPFPSTHARRMKHRCRVCSKSPIFPDI